ncbi:MAG: S1C family serine protease [Omnitrophica WOR_2 bacterium]
MKIMKILMVLAVLPALLLAACSGVSASLQNQPGVSAQVASNQAAQSAQTAAIRPINQAVPLAQVQVPTSLSAFQDTFEQIYTKVNPSVVNIQTEISATAASGNNQGNSPFGNPFNNPNQGGGSALGSGFIWDVQGHIVTNNHVISGASKITVTFSDGSVYDATVVGADANADLAVLKVNAPASLLVPVEIADSTQVKVGQIAVAIGNPYGLSGSMTEGIVSALQRSLPVGESQTSGPHYSIPDIIQTDASINPGNSGGVLVDDQGRLIGVTAAIESATNSNSGIGFVIPSAIVKKVVPALISSGKYDHPWLGISGTDLTPDLTSANNLKSTQRGVLVVSVVSGSPAEKAGLQGSTQANSSSNIQATPTGGDVIVGIDNQPVKSFGDLSSYLFNNTKPGQTVTLNILRNGQQRSLQLTLGTLPASGG